MKKLSVLTRDLINQNKQKQLLPEECEISCDANQVGLANDREGKKQLSVALSIFFDALNLYGKQPQQLESTTRLFMFTLADYPYNKISEALRYYSKHYSDMPTPADIITIIERGNKPPYDRAVYVNIAKKDPSQRTGSEWAYMRDYERFKIEGKF